MNGTKDLLMEEVKAVWKDPKFVTTTEKLLAVQAIFLREIARKL